MVGICSYITLDIDLEYSCTTCRRTLHIESTLQGTYNITTFFVQQVPNTVTYVLQHSWCQQGELLTCMVLHMILLTLYNVACLSLDMEGRRHASKREQSVHVQRSVIGASRSEPHTSESNGEFFHLWYTVHDKTSLDWGRDEDLYM